MVGKTVHQYQFLEKLGAGGMGEIWKAQDTRLNRNVAVKVLTSASAGDPERRRRFIQEAQAASALNHPNIITIHDIVSDGDSEFMVMEYVQGRTLVDLIPKGGLRVPQVLKLGVQMTDALHAAHSAGIIHRDLKPGNVMVTESGLVKILDFGLAKLSGGGPLNQTISNDDATRTIAQAPLTVEGSIIGTVSYMSPEQAQGRKVDARSDIFSFGLVLYEMLTGTRAFDGESALSTLSAILRDDAPPIPSISPDVPEQMDALVQQCLRKDPDSRFQAMRDVQAALMSLKRDSDSGLLYSSRISAPLVTPASSTVQAPLSEESTGKKSSKMPLFAAVGVAVALAIAAGVYFLTRPGVEPPVEEAKQEVAPGTVTNADIVRMIQANVALEVILGQVRQGPTAFDLSPQGVIELSQAGLPSLLIEAMRDPSRIPADLTGPPPAEEEKADVAAPSSPAQSAPSNPAPTQTAKSAKPSAPSVPPVKTKASDEGKAKLSKEEIERRLQEILAPAGAGAAPETPTATPPAPPVAPPPPPVVTSTRDLTITNGHPFAVVLATDIRQDAVAGSPLRFTVKDDVRVDGAVVIAKGANVSGAIAQAAKKRLIGSTKATLRFITVTGVDGKPYRIRALSGKSNGGDSERSVETNVKPASDDLAASAGTEYIAYIDGDQKITVK